MADGELFTVFVDSSPALSLPTVATDEVPVVRNGVAYKVNALALSGGGVLTPGTITNATVVIGTAGNITSITSGTGGGTLTGAGTGGYVAVWSSPTNLATSSIYDSGVDVTLTQGSLKTPNQPGTAGNGVQLNVQAGNGGATSGNGADVYIKSGYAYTGNGGGMNIYAGSAYTDGNGGNFLLKPGSGSGSGFNGSMSIQGNGITLQADFGGAAHGGPILIAAGTGANGQAGGGLVLQSGNAGSGAAGTDASLSASAAASGSGLAGGNVVLGSGAKDGAGRPGTVLVGGAGLPSAATGLLSGSLWYDPADGNRVKFVP